MLEIQGNINELTTFGRLAVNAYLHHRYVGAILSGAFGKGKSCSAMHMAYEILHYLHPNKSEKEIWQMVLDNIVFGMDEVIEVTGVLKTVDWASLSPQEVIAKKAELRRPIVIWDDAGKHGSKYKHFLDMDAVFELQSNFDSIRDVVSCLIVTVPEKDELLKFLRNYRGNYQVEINIPRDGGEYHRILEFWRYEMDYRGRRNIVKKWTSKPFSMYIPREIYGEYERMKTIASNVNYDRYEEKKQFHILKKQYMMRKMKKEMEGEHVGKEEAEDGFLG